MSVIPLATLDDLQDGWRKLSTNESRIARTLLYRASALVMSELRMVSCNNMTELLRENCKTVVCDMVRYSMVNAQAGDTSLFGEITDNAMWETELEGGGLRLTDQHRIMLGINQSAIGTIGYVHGEIYR